MRARLSPLPTTSAAAHAASTSAAASAEARALAALADAKLDADQKTAAARTYASLLMGRAIAVAPEAADAVGALAAAATAHPLHVALHRWIHYILGLLAEWTSLEYSAEVAAAAVRLMSAQRADAYARGCGCWTLGRVAERGPEYALHVLRVQGPARVAEALALLASHGGDALLLACWAVGAIAQEPVSGLALAESCCEPLIREVLAQPDAPQLAKLGLWSLSRVVACGDECRAAVASIDGERAIARNMVLLASHPCELVAPSAEGGVISAAGGSLAPVPSPLAATPRHEALATGAHALCLLVGLDGHAGVAPQPLTAAAIVASMKAYPRERQLIVHGCRFLGAIASVGRAGKAVMVEAGAVAAIVAVMNAALERSERPGEYPDFELLHHAVWALGEAAEGFDPGRRALRAAGGVRVLSQVEVACSAEGDSLTELTDACHTTASWALSTISPGDGIAVWWARLLDCMNAGEASADEEQL